MILWFQAVFSLVLADQWAEETSKNVRLFGWRKLVWGVFTIYSHIAQFVRLCINNILTDFIGIPIIGWVLYIIFCVLMWFNVMR